jgi:hypothetical protein
MRLLGGVAHLFDRDRIEIAEKGFARPAQGRINSPLDQHRVCAEIVGIGGAQRHRGTHDLTRGDAPALTRQLIAASRPAHPLEDFGVNQPLEQCLQMAWGQFMTLSQDFGANRRRARMQRDIDNGGNSENAPLSHDILE